MKWNKWIVVWIGFGIFMGACAKSSPSSSSRGDCANERVVDEKLIAFLSKARAAHHAADLYESNKNIVAAVASLEEVVRGDMPGGSVRPSEVSEVLADTRARIAELKSELGKFDEALAEVERGLGDCPKQTHYEGHLYEVKGLIFERKASKHEADGKSDLAAAVKKEAIVSYERAIAIQSHVIQRALGDAGKAN